MHTSPPARAQLARWLLALFALGQLSALSRLGSEAGAGQLTRALKELGGPRAVSSVAREARHLARSVAALRAIP